MWTSGYVSEVGYTHGFYRELTPELLRFCLMAKNQVSNKVTNYCELGCGQGFSANLLAAANPDINFFATDFNPSQISGAQMLAETANLKNIRLYDTAFSDFADEPSLPAKFDVIALHGIYSWISKENRRAIVDFIAKKLKIGGIVYISYNALPGWAPFMPMRRLFVDYADASKGPILDRIGSSIEFVEKLASQSRYFASLPAFKDRIEKVKSQNKSYLAHEYFNADWEPFYFEDVVNDMDGAKLSYVGPANILDYIDVINITKEQQDLLSAEPESIRKESMRDFLVNQQFRRDIFVKGSVTNSFFSSRQEWLNSRFVLTLPRNDVPLKVKGLLGDADLQESIYSPLLDAFADGPALIGDILQKNDAISLMGWPNLIQSLCILVGAGHLQPCLPHKGEGKRKQQITNFNKVVIEKARASTDLTFLASPVTGSGFSVSRVDQLFLLSIQSGINTSTDWASFAWNILNPQGQKLVIEGKTLETPEENLAELTRQAKEFEAKRLPVLKQLGIA